MPLYFFFFEVLSFFGLKERKREAPRSRNSSKVSLKLFLFSIEMELKYICFADNNKRLYFLTSECHESRESTERSTSELRKCERSKESLKYLRSHTTAYDRKILKREIFVIT